MLGREWTDFMCAVEYLAVRGIHEEVVVLREVDFVLRILGVLVSVGIVVISVPGIDCSLVSRLVLHRAGTRPLCLALPPSLLEVGLCLMQQSGNLLLATFVAGLRIEHVRSRWLDPRGLLRGTFSLNLLHIGC